MPRRAAYRPANDRSRTGGWSSRAAYRRAHHTKGGPVKGYKEGKTVTREEVRAAVKKHQKSPTRDDPLEQSGVQQKFWKWAKDDYDREEKESKARKAAAGKTKKTNPNTKSGRSYTLADLASGDVKLGDALKDTKLNKRQGTVRSIDKKDPKKTAKEIESVLKGPKKTKKNAGGVVKKPAVPGYKRGGKIRSVGICQKGVRACKMR